jgi:sporulation protein YlmC with PRC-barrel domain
MKTKVIIIIGSVLASCLGRDASAQFGEPARAGEILGSTIKDSQDRKVGTVKDLAVDLENGRVVEVIVAWGGFMGLDNKLVAATPDNFATGAESKTLHLVNMDKGKLEGAPAVDLSNWKDAMIQSRVEQVYQYYGLTPYFLVQEHLSHAASVPVMHPLGEVERASQLIGTETLNRQDQKIGKAANLIIDLPQERVIEVIINSGRFLGLHDELSAVPPQALHFDADRSVLTMDTTKEALGVAPHFPARTWPDINREQATEVYQAYHVIPYFLPIGMDSSAQNLPDLNSKAQPPLDQGTSQADLEITARIQKEILDTDGLSMDARAVKITTVNGRVTLRGMAASPDEKRRMGEIAARVVPAADVDNQLEVKETAASAAN